MSANKSSFRDHLVICGWKPEMESIVREILYPFRSSRRSVTPQIVLITKSAQAKKGLERVHVVEGDFLQEEVLVKACIGSASSAMILGEDLGLETTATEVDANTVMAALAIRRLSPGIYLVAELLDLDFENYLRMAHVDEIIYSAECARIVFANATSSPGLSHVIHELLSPSLGCDLEAVPIPNDFIGKSFRELRQYFETICEDRMICIGILENTRNLKDLKRSALIDAQKSPEIRTILKNLGKVKELETNRPYICPGDRHLVKENSLAIVISSPNTANAEVSGSG
jgi:voltage-gated potassium channel